MAKVTVRALKTISTPAGLITRGGTALVPEYWAHQCAARGLVEFVEKVPVVREEFNAPPPTEVASPPPVVETRSGEGETTEEVPAEETAETTVDEAVETVEETAAEDTPTEEETPEEKPSKKTSKKK